jgi:ATP-dependent Clp protease, protease subunit
MSSYAIPNVVRTDPRGDRIMDVYSHLLGERIVYLGTEIDDGVSNALIAQILHLESESADQPINLYINSPGGSLTATFAVYDAMQFVRAPVATTCIGQACSTAAILLAAGDAGRRSILPHARVLLHQPYSGAGGQASDIEIQAKEILRMRQLLDEVIAYHTGQAIEKVSKDTDRDFIMSADEAKDYGIIDEVISTRELAKVPQVAGVS